MAKVQYRLVKKNFKYGHELPKTVKESYELEKKNNTTQWKDSIAKEMTNLRIAFNILEC